MKKTKFLALVLVAAIALMGAGYAWWTDTLVVDSTVNTGYLDVDFIDYSHEPSSDWVKVIDHRIAELEGDGEDYPNGSKDKVILTIQDMYPDSSVKQNVTVKNVGTMPVNLCEMVITSADGNADTLAKMILTVNGNEFEFNDNIATVDLESIDWEYWDHFYNPWHRCGHWCDYYVGDPSPDPVDYLEPGESVEFVIEYKLDESAENDITENEQVTFELTLNCDQYNRTAAE